MQFERGLTKKSPDDAGTVMKAARCVAREMETLSASLYCISRTQRLATQRAAIMEISLYTQPGFSSRLDLTTARPKFRGWRPRSRPSIEQQRKFNCVSLRDKIQQRLSRQSTWVTRTNVLWIRNCVLLYRRMANTSCSLTRWQHFSAWLDVMAAILKCDIR